MTPRSDLDDFPAAFEPDDEFALDPASDPWRDTADFGAPSPGSDPFAGADLDDRFDPSRAQAALSAQAPVTPEAPLEVSMATATMISCCLRSSGMFSAWAMKRVARVM